MFGQKDLRGIRKSYFILG